MMDSEVDKRIQELRASTTELLERRVVFVRWQQRHARS